jgi:FtsP/CotA-like multicopper oxidase with cupredoxin domain
MKTNEFSRRDFLKTGFGVAGLGIAGRLAASLRPNATAPHQQSDHVQHGGLIMPSVVGEVDHALNGFNPSDILTDFDSGQVSTLESGQTLREYDFFAGVKTVELMPGLEYEAWTYNGRIPGPIIRATEGDRIRINLINGTDHPHTIHFHGIHPANMDGVFEPVLPGETFVYEFDAEPFGLHLYHCHIAPLASHISRGLYGAFIIDPREGRPPAGKEFIMVMAGFDPDFDGENNIYTVNTIPFHYDRHPIKIKVGELVRLYVVNLLEFDQTNSFHLHANFFHYYPTGTSLTPNEFTDTIAFMQGQRGIMEFRYKYPGKYMFHAHKTEFAELGWTGLFEVEE